MEWLECCHPANARTTVITARDESRGARDCNANRLPAFLINPFNLEQFLAAVHDALTTARVLDRKTKVQHSSDADHFTFCANN